MLNNTEHKTMLQQNKSNELIGKEKYYSELIKRSKSCFVTRLGDKDSWEVHVLCGVLSCRNVEDLLDLSGLYGLVLLRMFFLWIYKLCYSLVKVEEVINVIMLFLCYMFFLCFSSVCHTFLRSFFRLKGWSWKCWSLGFIDFAKFLGTRESNQYIQTW